MHATLNTVQLMPPLARMLVVHIPFLWLKTFFTNVQQVTSGSPARTDLQYSQSVVLIMQLTSVIVVPTATKPLLPP